MSDPIRFENYELLRHADGSPLELGRGAMGVTYKARDTDLHCDVALKVINPGILGSPEVRDRFLREARAAARLRHTNIASVFRLGVTADGTHYYAMEFCDGQTLQQALAVWGPLPTANAVHLAWQVSRALRVAEQQRLIHRDLKPANLILVETPDEGLVVKVIDFGLAKSFADGHQTFSTSGPGFAGTAHFASPEQIDERDLDIRSDIYSLGVCLWFMLTGQPPFEGSAARVMSQTLSAELPWSKLTGQPAPVLALLRRMLAKDRDNRPVTAAALRVEMERCMEAIEAEPQAPDLPAPATAGVGKVLGQRGTDAPSDEAKPTIKAAPGETDAARIGARFQLGERLGRDPLGRIFRATDREDGGAEVCYRVIESALTAVPATRRELDAQLAAARAHPHPNLVNVLASAVTGQGHIVVTEKIAGFTLLELLKHRGALPPHEALLLLAPLAAAADHAAAHGLRGLSLGKAQTWVHFPGEGASENRRLALAGPAGTWTPHVLKVEALSLGGPAGGDEDAMQSMATLATAGQGFGLTQRPPPAALAQLAIELLGGSTGSFTPIARLSEDANTILRRACTDPAFFPTATAFLTALRPALGKAPAPVATTPRTAAPAPGPATAIPRPPPRALTIVAATVLILGTLGLGYFYGIHAPRERARDDRRIQAEAATRDLAEKQRLANAEYERLKIEADKAQAEAVKAQEQMEETRLALAREAAAPKASTPAPQAAVVPPMEPAKPPAPPAPVPPSIFHNAVLDKDVLSPSGKIRIKHWRHDNEDDGAPLRRIALESAANPAAFSILFEHRRSADVLVSPDDQYLVVNNHPGSSGGGGQLYRQVTAEPPHYAVAAGFQGDGQELQDRAWAFYLAATGRKPNSDRDHVLINAKAWSPDSRTITLRIVGVGSNNDRSVPSPWECEYALGTQQFRALSPSNNPGSTVATSLPGERYPETRIRLLKLEDIQSLTDDKLRYAINEMVARRGADFRDKDIKKIFAKFPWYRPVAGKSYEQAEAEFTPIEEQNLKLLGALRDQRAGRPTQILPDAGVPREGLVPNSNPHGIPEGSYRDMRPINKQDANGSARLASTFVIRGSAFDFIVESSFSPTVHGRSAGAIAFAIKEKTIGKIVQNGDGTVRLERGLTQVVSHSPANLSEAFLNQVRIRRDFDGQWAYRDGAFRNLGTGNAWTREEREPTESKPRSAPKAPPAKSSEAGDTLRDRTRGLDNL